MENIHRGEEPGHFTVIYNLSEISIALLEEEIKYIRAKLLIKSRQK
jgi:hypothetical protein